MTFLNPAVLIGLLAAALPLLLHLLNLRKLRVVEFSTISFLQELQKSTLRRLKFQYWLLLLLRTLLILSLVFAFARPVLHGTFEAGGHAATTMVIILDDSYSMGRTDEHGTLFSQAQARAQDLLSLLREGDDGLILRLSDGGNVQFSSPTRNISLLKTIVQETTLSAIHRPVDDALRASARLLRQSTNPNKEIFILSDMQKAVIRPQTDSSAIRSLFNNDVNVFASAFGHSSVHNTGITDTRVATTLIDLHQPCVVTTTVKNFGQAALRSLVVSAYLGNTRVQQKSIDLSPQQSATIEFPLRLQNRGINNGSVRIEDDQCEYDNTRYFSIDVPDAIRILLVSQSPDDFMYLRTALSLSQPAERSSLFSITSSAWSGLAQAGLRETDIVIASISNSQSTEDLQRLKSFAANRRTLILFPAQDLTTVSVRRYSTVLKLPGIDSVSDNRKNRDQFLTLDRIDNRHPIFNEMFEHQDGTRSAGTRTGNTTRLSDAPRVHQSLILRPTSKSTTLITLSDGNGFLAEYPSDGGRILVFAVPPTPGWSEFPFKGLFVPLLYRTMLYGREAVNPTMALLCGDPISFSIPASSIDGQKPWAIVAPDGDETRVKPRMSARQANFTVNGTTTLNGFYTLMHGTKPFAQYAVNIDPGESDLTPLDESAFSSHLLSYGIPAHRIIRLAASGNPHDVVLESRYGRELWRYALIITLMCALLEMIVAHRTKQYARQETP